MSKRKIDAIGSIEVGCSVHVADRDKLAAEASHLPRVERLRRDNDL